MSGPATVTVNGEVRAATAGTTVEALVDELGGGRRGVAVAVNEEIVPRSAWARTVVPPGARVEVLRAIQGGC